MVHLGDMIDRKASKVTDIVIIMTYRKPVEYLKKFLPIQTRWK